MLDVLVSLEQHWSDTPIYPIRFGLKVFLARDSIYAIARYMPSPVRLSVCPSACLSLCPSVRHTGGSVKDV